MDNGELRQLRDRVDTLAEQVQQLAIRHPDSTPAMTVATKTVTTYPTVTGVFYACDPVDPGGTESEGSTGTFATLVGTVFVMVLGTSVPPSGTKLIAHSINGRWEAQY